MTRIVDEPVPGTTVAAVFSPLVPRSVRHGVVAWLGQRGLICIPFCDPWKIVAQDWWERGPTHSENARLMVLIQDRRKMYAVGLRLCGIGQNCLDAQRLVGIYAETFTESSYTPASACDSIRTSLTEYAEKATLSPSVTAIGSAAFLEAVSRVAGGIVLPKHVQTMTWAELGAVAARVADYASKGAIKDRILSWRYHHGLALLADAGEPLPVLASTLDGDVAASFDIRLGSDSDVHEITVVDFPAPSCSACIPVDSLLIRPAGRPLPPTLSLRIEINAIGAGMITLSEARRGKLEARSDFILF